MNSTPAPTLPPLGRELEQLRGMLALLEQSLAAFDAICSGVLDNPWRVVAAVARTRDVLLERDASPAGIGAHDLQTLGRDLAATLAGARQCTGNERVDH